jgi:hypothetical protein
MGVFVSLSSTAGLARVARVASPFPRERGEGEGCSMRLVRLRTSTNQLTIPNTSLSDEP